MQTVVIRREPFKIQTTPPPEHSWVPVYQFRQVRRRPEHGYSRRGRNAQNDPMQFKWVVVAVSHAVAHPAGSILGIVCAGPESPTRFAERLWVVANRPDFRFQNTALVHP